MLAPGSRSAPFAYVLRSAAERGLLRLHVRVDERTAGFVALGLAKASNRPVPVVTTSGTAAANLHPAVLEAAAAGVPLVAISADRPGALRHTGANQTTDQLHLFGTQVRGFAAVEDDWSATAWAAETGRLIALARGVRTRSPGPVHLNVSLSDPLVPSRTAEPVRVAQPEVAAAPLAEPVTLPAGPRTVVVAGDASPEVGRSVAALCARARIPLLAEPSSNARRGAAALVAGRVVLSAPGLAGEIERVIVVGRPTLSREITALLSRADIEQVVVGDRADWSDPGLVRPSVVDAVDLAPDDTDWLVRWRRADEAVQAGIDALLHEADPLCGPLVARILTAAIPAEAPLVVGSSSPVRDLDLASIRDDQGDVYANRGLAGIDGTLSTAVGIALATDRPTHALVGDLTFLHDLTGLVIGPGEPRPDLRIVVANDDGGSIFATLEHGRAEYADAHERVFATPHHTDLTALAAALGSSSCRVRTADELRTALVEPPRGSRWSRSWWTDPAVVRWTGPSLRSEPPSEVGRALVRRPRCRPAPGDGTRGGSARPGRARPGRTRAVSSGRRDRCRATRSRPPPRSA